MAETFLEEIYQNAYILEMLQECLESIASEDVMAVRRKWKETSASIERWIPELGKSDLDSAKEVLKNWKNARETNGDFRRLYSEIAGGLEPCIRAVLKKLQVVDVSENGWRLLSSETGFLTLQRIEDGHFLYNTVDPMWEVNRIARQILHPEMESVHILGAGLGYLPYAIWELSQHSIDIYIYEDQLEVLDYAFRYGTLEWIDPNRLHIVKPEDSSEGSIDRFLQNFMGATEDKDSLYICEWKTHHFSGTYAQKVSAFDYSLRVRRSLRNQWVINLRCMQARNPQPVKDLPLRGECNEVVLVSAGPSLNENMEFIRDNKGKSTIIAVNTVLKRLYQEEIKPDLIVMLDPLPEVREHLRGIEGWTEGIPLVTSIISDHFFVEAYRGPIYLFPIHFDDRYIQYTPDEEDSPWDDVAGTVTSLGLETAFFLGAESVYLVGSDLAFPNGENYASGVAHGAKEGIVTPVEVDAVGGGKVPSSHQYILYRHFLEAQIAKHPDVKVYNLSRCGARIAGSIE